MSRAHTGKHRCSPRKEKEIKIAVADHLGAPRGLFPNGLCENYVGNTDKTNFILNIDNSRTFEFSGEMEVRYADVVFGKESLTMMVGHSGGLNARIEPPFIVFMNKSTSCQSKVFQVLCQVLHIGVDRKDGSTLLCCYNILVRTGLLENYPMVVHVSYFWTTAAVIIKPKNRMSHCRKLTLL